MRRGTTPTYTFPIPFSIDSIATAKVTFAQSGVLVEKKLEDCGRGEDEISVKLTQEETFRFSEGAVSIQLRVLTEGGDALASDPMHDMVDGCLDEEVLTV